VVRAFDLRTADRVWGGVAMASGAALGVGEEAVLAVFSAQLSFAAGLNRTRFALAFTAFLGAESVSIALASPISEGKALS